MIDRLTRALAGRYRVERELGAGGMATVYLARDLRHDRDVAIKVLKPELVAAAGAERFLREITISAQLQHPHILALLESGEADGLLFYVMPYVDGESLRSRLAREGQLPVPDALRILRDVADALAHAESHGVVHRDIKPDNIMLAGRHALVVDFGVAKAIRMAAHGETLTSIGTSLGTPSYMAPEQAAGESNVDVRADLYALGVVAYEMLAGQPPFGGSVQAVMAAHITQEPPPLVAIRKDIPPPVRSLIERCLRKNPADRFPSAGDLLAAVEAATTATAAPAGMFASAGARRATLAGAAVLLVAVTLLSWSAYGRSQRTRWVREVAIPEVQRLATAIEYDSAFVLAKQARAIVPDDPTLNALWERVSTAGVLLTEPAGATVFRASFTDTSQWEPLGRTPTDTVRIPLGAYSRLRIEREGFRPMRVLVAGFPRAPFMMDSLGAPDADMVHVSRGAFSARLPGLDQLPPAELGDFLMGRHEVTNREYKAFVNAGGYTSREFWSEPFVKDGRPLAWEEGMALLTDKTGRPGPSTWEGGDMPAGQEELPVGGLSWYEAMAYARFAKRALPTVYHWSRAAETAASAYVVPGSNMESTAPQRGSLTRGMSPFGAFDMAGNVREWCVNADAQGKHYILGGGFSDLPYAFNDAYAQDPFDRSVINGVRLAKYLRDEPNLAFASRPLPSANRDYASETPASGEVYESYRRMYDYDRLPLDAKVESRDTTPADWITERVSFSAAYGHERVVAYLFLPKRRPPPYQVVVHFPGDNWVHVRSNAGIASGNSVDFFIRSGRAVIFPVYKSTGERSDSLESSIPNESIDYRDHVLMWAKDVRRAVDYVQSRADLDSIRLAYFGVSWGGRLGGLIPAVEPRLKTVVLFVAGFRMQRPRPEADPVNFVSRITQPVLLLNAKYDNYFPTETSQKPFFRMLGSPAADKRYVVYEGGHMLPRTQLISESLAWLDKYLGPVK